MTPRSQQSTAQTNFAIHLSNNDEDEKMNNVSPNGSVLNQDMNTEESEGNSFTVSTVLANTSSFALTDTCPSKRSEWKNS
jgi:hypothetical protein